MTAVSEIVSAWRAGRDLSMYRQAYSEMDMASFMRTFHCSSRIAIRIFGRNKNKSKNPRTPGIKERIRDGEFSLEQLRSEWMSCRSEKFFCKKYLTTSHTCRELLGDRVPVKERKLEPKESWIERYRRENREREEENRRVIEESKRQYDEPYYTLGNCVSPVMSSNLNII